MQIKCQIQEGKIIEYSWGLVFVGDILHDDGQTLTFYEHKIKDTILLSKAFIKEVYPKSGKYLMHKNGSFHYGRGLYFGIDYRHGSNTNLLSTEAGYRLNQKLNFGIGVGIHGASTTNGNLWLQSTLFPIYATGRYYLNDSNIRFYLATHIGYSFYSKSNASGSEKGGFYMQPTIGIHFSSSKKSRLTLKVSQYVQNISGTFNFNSFQAEDNVVRYRHRFSRFMIGVGWEFY